MSPAKPVTARIREPRNRKGKGRGSKPPDFSSAGRSLARSALQGPAARFGNATYALSAHDPGELPAPGIPEIAFAGRSNAGKSSAINALAGRRRLAFVSKTPGRTQLINFFSLGGEAYLVDLPGYGYAGVPGAVREHWESLVGGYIAHRESIVGVVVVMDARHPLTPLDRQLLEWLREAGRPAHLLLTKADKLSRQAARATLTRVQSEAATLHPGTTSQLFSSLKREGVEEAAAALARFAGSRKNKAPAKGE